MKELQNEESKIELLQKKVDKLNAIVSILSLGLIACFLLICFTCDGRYRGKYCDTSITNSRVLIRDEFNSSNFTSESLMFAYNEDKSSKDSEESLPPESSIHLLNAGSASLSMQMGKQYTTENPFAFRSQATLNLDKNHNGSYSPQLFLDEYYGTGSQSPFFVKDNNRHNMIHLRTDGFNGYPKIVLESMEYDKEGKNSITIGFNDEGSPEIVMTSHDGRSKIINLSGLEN